MSRRTESVLNTEGGEALTSAGARCSRLPMLLAALLAATRGLGAQPLAVVPSFEITELYDDNVFYRPAAERDTTTRLSSRLDVRQGSQRASFAARYALDADRFADHAELSTLRGRQEAGFDARYLASRRLSISGVGTYLESQTPGDLNQESGVAPGRVRAERAMLQPSATYQLGTRTDTTVGYAVTRDALAGGATLLSQSATSTLHYRRSDRDGLAVGYVYQRYAFGQSTSADIRHSEVFTVEWTHAVSRLTSLTFRTGPRLTDGLVSAEIAASVRRELPAGEASLGYLHTQTTLIGLAGVADTHMLDATFAAEPRRRLTLRARPGVSYTKQLELSSTVYRLSLSCARPIARRLAFEADYDLNLQRGNIYTAHALETVARNLALIKLVVADTAPARQP